MSSHDLLRSPSVLIPATSICRDASGRTVPEGWLQALKVGAPLRFMIASAMMDRLELPVQRNETL
jgi:hypothetical protein